MTDFELCVDDQPFHLSCMHYDESDYTNQRTEKVASVKGLLDQSTLHSSINFHVFPSPRRHYRNRFLIASNSLRLTSLNKRNTCHQHIIYSHLSRMIRIQQFLSIDDFFYFRFINFPRGDEPLLLGAWIDG